MFIFEDVHWSTSEKKLPTYNELNIGDAFVWSNEIKDDFKKCDVRLKTSEDQYLVLRTGKLISITALGKANSESALVRRVNMYVKEIEIID